MKAQLSENSSAYRRWNASVTVQQPQMKLCLTYWFAIRKTPLMMAPFGMPTIQGLTHFGEQCKQVFYVKLSCCNIKHVSVSSLFCIITAETYFTGSAISFSSVNWLFLSPCHFLQISVWQFLTWPPLEKVWNIQNTLINIHPVGYVNLTGQHILL